MIKLPAIVFLVMLACLASCGRSAEFEAAVASCEQAVREQAENPQSITFGQILHEHVEEWPEPNSWDIYGEFTQTVGDRILAPHFYNCLFVLGEFSTLKVFTGHAADVDNAASRVICQRAVAQRSEFPDRADFESYGPNSDWGSLLYWKIQGTVGLMNDSGDMIPHNYYCDIEHGKILGVRLTEAD